MAGKEIEIDSKNFDRMIVDLQRKAPKQQQQIADAIAAATILQAARNTNKSSVKKIAKDVEDMVKHKGVRSPNGDMVKAAKNGAMIWRGNDMPAGRWIKIRGSFSLSAIGKKNPGVRDFGRKLQPRINKTLAAARKYSMELRKYKKTTIAAGQGSFLYMMKMVNLPIEMKRLGPAVKAKISSQHKKVLSAKRVSTKNDKHIRIHSRSTTALNKYAGGISAFKDAIFGQRRQMERKSEKQLKDFTRQLGKRFGFTVK